MLREVIIVLLCLPRAPDCNEDIPPPRPCDLLKYMAINPVTPYTLANIYAPFLRFSFIHTIRISQRPLASFSTHPFFTRTQTQQTQPVLQLPQARRQRNSDHEEQDHKIPSEPSDAQSWTEPQKTLETMPAVNLNLVNSFRAQTHSTQHKAETNRGLFQEKRKERNGTM